MPTRLAAYKIRIRYASDASPILDEFTLELETGIFLGVLGPNGSGKSTLVRTLSRALKPSSGAVLLDGCDLYAEHSARSAAQKIAVVPQETTVSLGFSVREVVRMGRAPHLPARPFAAETMADEASVSQALRDTQVEDLAERPITTLSGGERQRVLFARALAQETDVLLLDEPTSSLDLRHQSEILTLSRSLAHRDGKAVVAVLHDVNQASAYCDHIVLLSHGTIAARGTPAEVLTAENMQAVYGARVWVSPSPVSGKPLVLSLPAVQVKGAVQNRPRVHVICGAGTGAGLLLALDSLGFPITVGCLHASDPDAEAARMLNIPFAQEVPFSLLSSGILAQAEHLAQDAAAIVLTAVPFGLVNIANLEAALALCQAGKRVLCERSTGIESSAWDHTSGVASRMWSALLAAGAEVLPSAEAIIRQLEQWKAKGDGDNGSSH